MPRKLGKRLADIRGLLDRLDASMLSVNERVTPEPSPSRTVPSYRVAPVPIRHPKPDLPTASAAAAAADVDLLLGSADDPGTFLPPDRTLSTTGGRNTGGDAASASAVLQHNMALQDGLAVHLAHIAGQLRWNVELSSGTLAADQRRRVAEKMGANQEVMEWERLCDRRWKALGTSGDMLRLRFW
ncbi:hypothetical protein EDB89DRAFT_2232634 [Lactarius sanguifluus]|nr:hypothetical protein EDB89DRAFT_2232634 [Lactarius sanguifluus]